MKELFEMKQVDKDFYRNNLQEFLPGKILDVHTHIWLDRFKVENSGAPVRAVLWPSMVAKDNSVEDLFETYRLMFPDKKVSALLFGQPSQEYDIHQCNAYVKESAKKYGMPSLFLSKPAMSAEEFEKGIEDGGFLGCKVYLNYAPDYIPENEIRIFDFLPHEHLEVLNRRGWVAMLHIARPGRLKDPVNLHQMLEIEQRYPFVKLIIAHGRQSLLQRRPRQCHGDPGRHEEHDV